MVNPAKISEVTRMKIAFIHPAFRDYRLRLFEELSNLYDVTYIFTAQGRPVKWNYKNILIIRNSSIKAYLKLMIELLKGKNDIILSSTKWYICFPIAKITGKKFILLTEYWLFSSDSMRDKVANFLSRLIAKNADAVIVTGTKPYESYLRMGVKDEKIFQCIQCSNDYSREPAKELRNDLGLQDKRIILYLSRIIPRKGLNYLLKAFSIIEKENNVVLIIIGEGPFKKECEKLANELCLKNVIFKGYVDDQVSYFKACDIFVLPAIFLGSDYEPWGLVINEAMSFSKPIITTDAVGAAYDLVRDGYNGYVINNKNEQELYEALYKLISNVELAKQMGENSRKIFEEKNDYGKMLEAFMNSIEYVKKNEVLE